MVFSHSLAMLTLDTCKIARRTSAKTRRRSAIGPQAMINIHVDMTRRLLLAISIIHTQLAKRASALALSARRD
jgi:hypothetical protein